VRTPAAAGGAGGGGRQGLGCARPIDRFRSCGPALRTGWLEAGAGGRPPDLNARTRSRPCRPHRAAADAGGGRRLLAEDAPTPTKKVDRLLPRRTSERMNRLLARTSVTCYADTTLPRRQTHHRIAPLPRDYSSTLQTRTSILTSSTVEAVAATCWARPATPDTMIDHRGYNRKLLVTADAAGPRPGDQAQDAADRRPATPPSVWIGANHSECAASCHEHKFDPFAPDRTSTARRPLPPPSLDTGTPVGETARPSSCPPGAEEPEEKEEPLAIRPRRPPRRARKVCSGGGGHSGTAAGMRKRGRPTSRGETATGSSPRWAKTLRQRVGTGGP